jgi:hypothetical protein
VSYRIALYSPDRGQVYDGRTPNASGVGGGITARVSMLTALAALGHDVTACVTRESVTHAGVRIPLDQCAAIDATCRWRCPPAAACLWRPCEVRGALRCCGCRAPQPADPTRSEPTTYVASHFAARVSRAVGIPASKLFVCWAPFNQAAFAAEARAIPGNRLPWHRSA